MKHFTFWCWFHTFPIFFMFTVYLTSHRRTSKFKAHCCAQLGTIIRWKDSILLRGLPLQNTGVIYSPHPCLIQEILHMLFCDTAAKVWRALHHVLRWTGFAMMKQIRIRGIPEWKLYCKPSFHFEYSKFALMSHRSQASSHYLMVPCVENCFLSYHYLK